MTDSTHDEGTLDALLDLLPVPIMSWQRRVIHNIVAAASPDELFCHQRPRDQLRLGCDYASLMEHYAIEVIRRG
jgi:hypothetical protein